MNTMVSKQRFWHVVSGMGRSLKLREIGSLLKSTGTAWIDDYAPSMGAALSYYTLFSIAPLLLIVISVAGLVFGQEAARGEIFGQLHGLMGAESALAIQALLNSVSQPAQSLTGTIVGVVMVLIGATTVFSELQNAMDRIWRAPARPKSSGILDLIHSRLLVFGVIFGIGFLLIVSLVLSAALAALGKWWAPLFGAWQMLAEGINFTLSFLLITVAFAMIYKVLPRVRVHWSDVWIGAFVTALLFSIGKYLIGLYIGKTGIASGFGAAGSLVIVLLWFYHSAQIFLLGAEFTWVYTHTFGSSKKAPPPAAPPITPTRNDNAVPVPDKPAVAPPAERTDLGKS